MKAKRVCVVVALMMVFSLAPTIMMATPVMAQGTIYVDVNNGGCVVGSGQPDPYAVVYCNIQDAIDDAVSGDTIVVALGQYNEHDITINKSLVIQGSGSGNTIVDGQDISRVFYINQSIVDMSGMTIQNGQIRDDGGGIYNNMGNVTLTSCNISSNEAYFDGGGIYNNGVNVMLTDCTVSDNTARDGNGGGIYNYGALTLTNCTISGNKAYYDGGGIYNNEDEVTLTNCTISGNEAETRNGGGIYAGGYYQTITSSTPDDGSYSWSIPLSYDDYSSYKVKITDTSDSSCYYYSNSYFALYDGCAIHVTSPTGGENWELGSTHTITWTSQLTGGNVKIELYKGSSTLNMTNCTVSNNDADKEGGGIYNDVLNTLTLRCTIVYGNMAGDYGDDIMNLSIVDDPTDESIVGDAFGYSGGDPDPLLGPLQNNGGPTTTHALSSLSPAIDACINGCTVDTDQRGYPRPIDGDYDSIADYDVGAYEYIPPPLPSPSPVPTLSQWGMIGMCILLAAALVWSVRRRWIVSADKS